MVQCLVPDISSLCITKQNPIIAAGYFKEAPTCLEKANVHSITRGSAANLTLTHIYERLRFKADYCTGDFVYGPAVVLDIELGMSQKSKKTDGIIE